MPLPLSPALIDSTHDHNKRRSKYVDVDSEFVRQIYERYEREGVLGDGVLDGVERTRERHSADHAATLMQEQISCFNTPAQKTQPTDRCVDVVDGP